MKCHHRTPIDDGILLPKEPKRDKRLGSSQGDCKPCHPCKDWKSNGVRKLGRVTNTHQPWNTELWGSGAITMVVRNPRRLQLVITNEDLIDLHKLRRFQTNLLYPVHLDYIPSDRGQANRESALMRDKILAWWWCCLKIFFIRDQWAPRSIAHLIHNHPHNPRTLSLHVVVADGVGMSKFFSAADAAKNPKWFV